MILRPTLIFLICNSLRCHPYLRDHCGRMRSGCRSRRFGASAFKQARRLQGFSCHRGSDRIVPTGVVWVNFCDKCCRKITLTVGFYTRMVESSTQHCTYTWPLPLKVTRGLILNGVNQEVSFENELLQRKYTHLLCKENDALSPQAL